jgi:UDP-N-acetylglucosamine transferase subunit ALG13
VIVVALGTHHQPMDRVVRWVDQLIGDGTIDEAIIQSAAFAERPTRATAVGLIPGDELSRLMETASRVVTHGGPGLILQARAFGRQPIVIARDPAFGEHVDGHQQRFVAWLETRQPVVPVATLEAFRSALLAPEDRTSPAEHETEAVRKIRALIVGERE